MSHTDNTLPLWYLRDYPLGPTNEHHVGGLYGAPRCERIGGTHPCDIDSLRSKRKRCAREPKTNPRNDRYWNWPLRHGYERPSKKERRLAVWKPTRQAERTTLHRIRAAHRAEADWAGIADGRPELLYQARGRFGGAYWD